MHALLHSRQWHYRLLRISILVAAGWWMWQAGSGLANAQLSNSSEWPKTDFTKTSIDLDEIMSGGPPKDGIPAVDAPKFISPAEADEWLDAREPVIVVDIAGDARAYPLQILIYHEIVNDAIGEVPYSVTFCPLCNASIVFDRRVDGRLLDFGTTGRLRKSDMVMYDRQTESWWQQFTGEAIVGELTGIELTQLPAGIVAYQDFKAAHPSGKVLSRETGTHRPYGRNPYRGYDSIDDRPFLFRDPIDPRLPAMERVLNVTVNGQHKLYPFSALRSEPVINDDVQNMPVVVFSREGTLSVLDNGNIVESRTIPSANAFARTLDDQLLTFAVRDGAIVDEQTKSHWDLLGNAVDGPLKGKQLEPTQGGVHFAFAWLAFNPDSDIYGQ